MTINNQPQTAEQLLGLLLPETKETPQFRAKPRSRKQCAIVAVLRKEPHITLAAAVELVGGDIYANANAHVGALLSNMVQKGMIKRLKPGVFSL